MEFGSARDKILFGVYNVYLRYVLPQIGRLVSRNKGAYTHLAESIAAFPSADELVAGMKIHKFYKDVTYETLKNKDFSERVMKEIPPSVLEGSLLQEHVAAKSGTVMS